MVIRSSSSYTRYGVALASFFKTSLIIGLKTLQVHGPNVADFSMATNTSRRCGPREIAEIRRQESYYY
uniref:Uncharacterized protein n=1 Tax=Oryza brachyantha TaxID=4533 RepID=J3MA17_ORYBR